MDALVPPINGQPGFVVNDDHRGSRGNHHDDGGKFMSLADRISTAAETVMSNDNSNAHHAASTAERIGLAGIDHVNQNGAEGRLVTNNNGSEGRLNTNQNGSEGRLVTNQNGAEIRGNTDRNGAEGRGVTERFGIANMEATRKEGYETREDVDKFGFRTQDAIERFGLKNLEATKDSLKDILISTKDDLKNVLISQKDDIKDLLISNKNDFKDVMLKNCQVEKDMLIQFKDAQLVAMQNKSDLEKQIAECCCENKELVRDQASITRDLIRSESESRLRDDLRRTQDELTALRIRASLVPPPVAAVSL